MNINKYTEKAQEAILAAQQLADREGHPEILPEHLLLTLLEQREGIVPGIVRKMNAEPAQISAAVRAMAEAGVAAVHIEDQVAAKICGHLPGKHLVSQAEMVERVKAAVSGKPYREFVVMARTDAAANEGIGAAIERARAYVVAGADMIFAEALHTLDDYRSFTGALGVPVLANLTEFGKTPFF